MEKALNGFEWKVPPEVIGSQKSQKNPQLQKKIHHNRQQRDEKLHTQRDSCGAFLPFNERFSSLPVPKPVCFSNAVWANIRPNILAQEVLKEHSFCYELVWTKERSSIGGVIVARNRGLLPIPRGEIQSSCFFCVVSTAIKGAARAPARRPWSRNEVCLLLETKKKWGETK